MAATIHYLARVRLADLAELNLGFVVSGGEPFEAIDGIDIEDDLKQAVFDMYVEAYSQLDPKLNVTDPDALLDYTRWLLVVGGGDEVVGFVLSKGSEYGVKVCALATDGSKPAKDAIKALLRRLFVEEGIYGEVSDAVEAIVADHAAWVGATRAAEILAPNEIEPDEDDEDGFHYFRVIDNVGRKRKLMVGKPDVG